MSDDLEYVVVETVHGEGIVCVVPCEGAVLRDAFPEEAPLPLEQAHEVANELNEAVNDAS